VTCIRRSETDGRPVFITAVHNRRIPYLKNLVGQVAPQALPDYMEFLFRFDRPFFWLATWLKLETRNLKMLCLSQEGGIILGAGFINSAQIVFNRGAQPVFALITHR